MGSKKKTMTKQLTKKRDDTPLHSAAREGDLEAVVEILSNCESEDVFSMKNQCGETVLYVAAESGHVDLVTELVKYYDAATAGVKARNGYDPFHIAAKQGDLGMVKVLMEAFPELSLTFDQLNTTALHTAAAQGHVEIVEFLLESNSGLAAIAKSNSKTALHSSARNGHLNVVKALLRKEPGMVSRVDKKGQTALHMAVKGLSDEVVVELLNSDSCLMEMVDGKGNNPLHIASRKGRNQIVRSLLNHESGVANKNVINKAGETALDTAQKLGNSEISKILIENGVQNANSIKANPTTTATTTPRARELKQAVSDIKHEVHDQLEHTRQTRKRVQGIAQRLNKMHEEGLNNAITSTTVVAVLIATVAFAAIFSVPGQYEDNPRSVPDHFSTGEARIGEKIPFMIFFISDSFALFISLAVVVVQTSVVAVERKAKKQMMFFINKLMWLACAFISVAYLALCYVVVGEDEKWFAVVVMMVGTGIMMVTFGTMSYWVIRHRIEASNLRSLRRSSRNSSRLHSWSASVMSDTEIVNKVYAI